MADEQVVNFYCQDKRDSQYNGEAAHEVYCSAAREQPEGSPFPLPPGASLTMFLRPDGSAFFEPGKRYRATFVLIPDEQAAQQATRPLTEPAPEA